MVFGPFYQFLTKIRTKEGVVSKQTSTPQYYTGLISLQHGRQTNDVALLK